MAIVTMKRLRLLAMREDREALLDDLQRLGCVEVSEPTLDGREEESGAAELLSRLTPPDAQALSQAQTRRQEAERAMGILKHYGANGRGFLTPRPQTSKEELCSPQATARQDQAVAGVLAEERRVNALLAQGEKLASQRAALAPWLALDVPLESRSTPSLLVQFGTLTAARPFEEAAVLPAGVPCERPGGGAGGPAGVRLVPPLHGWVDGRRKGKRSAPYPGTGGESG